MKLSNAFHQITYNSFNKLLFCLFRVFAESAIDLNRRISFTSGAAQSNCIANISQAGMMCYQWTEPLCANGNNLTKFNAFLRSIQQISYSYAFENNAWNVIKINGFNERMDPTRFLSLHCHLFPHLNSCSSLMDTDEQHIKAVPKTS